MTGRPGRHPSQPRRWFIAVYKKCHCESLPTFRIDQLFLYCRLHSSCKINFIWQLDSDAERPRWSVAA